jgi:hypothetical protein
VCEQNRFNVTINLADDSFQPGSKHFERVKWCLTDRLGLRFRLVMAWSPTVGGVGGGGVDLIAAVDGCRRLNPSQALHQVRLWHSRVVAVLRRSFRVVAATVAAAAAAVQYCSASHAHIYNCAIWAGNVLDPDVNMRA